MYCKGPVVEEWGGREVAQNDISETFTDKVGFVTFDKSHVCSCWRE